jgi:hypothetical protein
MLMVAACLCGCSPVNIGEQIGYSNGKSLDLQSEQVSLTQAQLNCGVDNNLFLPPESIGNRNVARLTDRGRSLGFSDDVTLDEPGFNSPYTQIRGTFPIQFSNIISIKDVETGVKRVELNAGVVISHECFSGALPLMGIRKGLIAQNIPPAFEFDQYGDEWKLEHILH